MTPGPSDPKKDFVAAPDPRAGRSKVSLGGLWLAIRVPLLLVVLAALGVASLLLYTSDRRTTRQGDLLVSPEDADALLRRSLQAEAAFEKVRQERFELKEADIALLEEALRLQEEYIVARQSVGTDSARQQSLRRRLHLIRGEQLRHDSDVAEAKALELAKTDEAAAIPFLRRAVACEQEIAKTWEFSGLADPGRVARLDTRLRRLESGPLWRQGRDLEAAAEKLLAAGRFPEAAAKFDEAIAAETDFLARYRDVRNTEFGRSDKLAERRETALSGEAWQGVGTLRARAEELEQAGNWAGAAQAWQGAVDAFAKLLTDYPKSNFAERTQEAKMAVRLNFCRFHGEIEAVRARHERLRATLRQRQADAAVRLAEELVVEARRLGGANTGTFLDDDAERKELEFLAANAAVVRAVLLGVDANLRPVPSTGLRMYRTEIPQALYASVMATNPSSVRREASPVESVTYAEAEAFAVRLGWILGAKVRLPTLSEYVAAAGDPAKLPDPAQARTLENSDGINVGLVGSAAANAAGFHDLFGNVEEWAQAVPADTRAPVFGGSIATPLGKVWAERQVFKREKSRTLGFRIVIE